MKRTLSLLSIILLAIAVYWRVSYLTPATVSDATTPLTEFSSTRALSHIRAISEKPHFVGSDDHKNVKAYLVNQLRDLGLEPEIQEGTVNGYRNSLIQASNVIARIPGAGPGPALVLMSHYDSNPHSSLGASDAGSGVAVILEGIRAYLQSGKTPVNDIIILFTDGEELGLLGAKLFVERSPYAKNTGLVLNFEARGSGGPGIMLIETNRGNRSLIESFTDAKVPYPLSNSLFYSIYKILPNDTDLTVFRQEADINGFNFAFIGDHFDYHTALDNYERLDRRTLEHQGSYLMPLLTHYTSQPVSTLRSEEDMVFFDFPFLGMVSYPFAYIFPLLAIAILAFAGLTLYGFKKQRINLKAILKGFLPILAALISGGILSYLAWPLLKQLYPMYTDMLHGFTYNGYLYIAAVAFLTLAICFRSYAFFKRTEAASLMFAPLLLWILLSSLMAFYLEGASFFVITTGFNLLAWWVMIRQKEPNPLLMLLLIIPALWMYSPMIRLFPVALGLKMLVGASLLTTLTFGATLPVLAYTGSKKSWSWLFLLLCVGCFTGAHLQSSPSEDRPHPSSLIYLQDEDSGKAYLATYNRVITPWLRSNIGEVNTNDLMGSVFSSKYHTPLSYSKEIPSVGIIPPAIEKTGDTVINGNRQIKLKLTPGRKTHRLEVFLRGGSLEQAMVNGEKLTLNDPGSGVSRLFTHYITNDAPTEIRFNIPPDSERELIIYEASNDLLTNPALNIDERPGDEIPMPFILNDAVITKTTVKF